MTSLPYLRVLTPGAFQGIVFVILGTATFSTMHALVRFVSTDIPPFEVAFFRNLFGLLIFVPWLARNGLRVLHTNRIGMHALRASLNSCSMLCWFSALAMVPLAEATALSLMTPLFVAIGASLYLRESVGFGRWMAVACGIVGTVVIMRPGVDAMSLGMLLVLASSVFATGSKIFAKELSDSDGAATIVAYVTLFMAPITLVPSLFVWVWPDLESLGWMLLIGVLATTSHVLTIRAYKWFDISLVEPFMFIRLAWAAGLGYLLFREVPALATWIGAFVIAVGIAVLAYSEYSAGQARRKAIATSPAD